MCCMQTGLERHNQLLRLRKSVQQENCWRLRVIAVLWFLSSSIIQMKCKQDNDDPLLHLTGLNDATKFPWSYEINVQPSDLVKRNYWYSLLTKWNFSFFLLFFARTSLLFALNPYQLLRFKITFGINCDPYISYTRSCGRESNPWPLFAELNALSTRPRPLPTSRQTQL